MKSKKIIWILVLLILVLVCYARLLTILEQAEPITYCGYELEATYISQNEVQFKLNNETSDILGYRDYYQFKRDGTVDFGRLKNDGTRNVLKKGTYKMDGKKVLIQWKHRGPKLKMTEEKLKELEKWHHVFDFDQEKNRLYLLSGEEFRRN